MSLPRSFCIRGGNGEHKPFCVFANAARPPARPPTPPARPPTHSWGKFEQQPAWVFVTGAMLVPITGAMLVPMFDIAPIRVNALDLAD